MLAADLFDILGAQLTANHEVITGQMFGKPCLKVGGKAFAACHAECVIFKLAGDSHAEAMALDGAALWDPSGSGRPMKEWVALGAEHQGSFADLAEAAQAYVYEGLPK